MSPSYYNRVFHENGHNDLYCEYINLNQFKRKETDQLILKVTQEFNKEKCHFMIINRGNTFPHIKINAKYTK